MATSASLRATASAASAQWPTRLPPPEVRPAVYCPPASSWSRVLQLRTRGSLSRCQKLGLSAWARSDRWYFRELNQKRRKPRADLRPDQEAAVHKGVAEYLERIGGKSDLNAVQTLFRDASVERLRKNFDLSPGVKGQVQVYLRPPAEQKAQQVDAVAQRVARELFRLGGSADLHQITGRFGISKKVLLAHAGGKIFDAVDGQLKLIGSAGAVAAAALAAGRVTTRPGRWRSKTDLLTTTGAATDPKAAERLHKRIEGLLVSSGDGALPVDSVYTALGLEPTPALRRWFRHSGFQIIGDGEIKVADKRLLYFRLRRAVCAAAVVAEAGGAAPLAAVFARVHRPPELAALEAEEQAVSGATGHRVRPPGGGFGHQSYGGDGSDLAESAVQPEPLALAIAKPPAWVDHWVRKFFEVDEDTVTFLEDTPATVLPLRALPRTSVAVALDASGEEVKPDALGFPQEPAPLSIAEEEGLLMGIEEEIRLRYGRAHISVLTGCFQGVKGRFFRRFFDVTMHGEVIPKGLERQTRELIAITRRVVAGGYKAEEAFREFGASKPWLRRYFLVDEEGVLGLDTDPERMWRPPHEEEAPSPWSYARLDAPRGYVRKGDYKYARAKYGHNAGGILY